MNSALAASLTYNELEYFSYLNHWLLFLFFLIVTFYSVLKVTTACLNKIHYNDAVLEFASTLFLLAFLLLVVSPALIVLLDIDSVVMPSFIIYNLGFQWAWTYSISYLHSNIGFTSYHDHYILSSYFYQSLNWCQQGAAISEAAIECPQPAYLFEVSTYLIMPLFSAVKIYCFSLDVIHSLSFCSFGFKVDAIPGRVNFSSSLRSLVKGVNRGFCYELCGEQHNAMLNTWILV